MSLEAVLFDPDPASYLPHRFPFLMLDRLVTLEPGHHACAVKRVTGYLAGFPQVLLVECVAQLGGIVSISEEGEGGFIASVDHAEFEHQACEGDTLTVSAQILKAFGRLFLVEGSVECNGKNLLQARMTLGVGKL